MTSRLFRPDIHRRALKVSLIVGCLLAVFNYSDTLLAGQMASNQWFKVIQRTLRGVVVLALMADANSG
jgi:hypothetical protein